MAAYAKHHKEALSAASGTKYVGSFFKPQVAKSVIEAETRWSMFVAKHNLAFLSSEHASKLFTQMFPDSEVAKKFGCGPTKCTAIVTEALAPHYLDKTVQKNVQSILYLD